MIAMSAIVLLGAAGCGGPSTGEVADQTDCATADTTFLMAGQLGSFTQIVSELFHSPPSYHGAAVGSTPPPFVTQYQAGRMVGFVANVAIDGPDRPAEDETARSLGYPIGRFPLVPLQGVVVKHNPGLLEIYETVSIFRTIDAASGWIASLRGSRQLDPESTVISETDSELVYETTLGPNDGNHEHMISYTLRIGARTLTLALQGGSSINPAKTEPLWTTAQSLVAASCR